jgi:hypothetical protein
MIRSNLMYHSTLNFHLFLPLLVLQLPLVLLEDQLLPEHQLLLMYHLIR